jgi:hypothetical protein
VVVVAHIKLKCTLVMWGLLQKCKSRARRRERRVVEGNLGDKK